MRYIVCYDISEGKIRYRVEKYLKEIGWRIQYSIFSCEASVSGIDEIKEELNRLTKKSNKKIILIIPICKQCEQKMWMSGTPIENADVPNYVIC